MFTTKKNTLIEQTTEKQNISVGKANAFVNAGLKSAAVISSENGAKKYSTTGNPLVDQFGQTAQYRTRRQYVDIAKDMDILWADNPLNAVKFALFIRTIPRKVTLLDGRVTEESQKGSELRWESIMRMIWLSQKSPETFKANLPLMISLGSWKDVFQMLQYDLIYNGWEGRVLDWTFMGNIIVSGLANTNSSELIKKYLPQIHSKKSLTSIEKQANTIIGKWICSLIFGNKEGSGGSSYKKYRILKSTGTAHEWQKLISNKKFDLLDFDKIHGRALKKLVSSKFLTNQKLKERYTEWVSDPETKTVKYTGFVHELFPSNRPSEKHIVETINKQFEELITKAGTKSHTSFIVVRDTSSSMNGQIVGEKYSANHVAKSLALYFSYFLTGEFTDTFIEFADDAKMHKWQGSTPVDKFYNDKCEAYGSTNFMSVIDKFCELRRTVAEEDFPTGIICVSDGEFNPTSINTTNVSAARKKLRAGGFTKEYVDNFVIVLWNLPNYFYSRTPTTKFETFGDVPNAFYFSGLSGSIISFLTGEIKTASELVENALNQEVLNMVEIYHK